MGVGLDHIMRILHINPGYPFTTLYRNMLDGFSTKHTHQVYVPLAVGRRIPEHLHWTLDSRVALSPDYRQLDRLFHGHKASRIARSLVQQFPIRDFDLIHAHFLFSAGGVARILKKQYGVKYVTSVRNTDVNTFFKYAPHLRRTGVSIMEGAEHVIYINPSYRDHTMTRFVPEAKRGQLEQKTSVVPNGIDSFWLDNINPGVRQHGSERASLLFVGEFTKNKNVAIVIDVARLLGRRGYDVTLDLVGDGPDYSRLKSMVSKADNIRFHGRIHSKQDLINLYRAADVFVMPSFKETFGLVYIEAMSQGVPVIYSKGQGIDGYFPEGAIGYSVDPHCPEDIAGKVVKLLNDRPSVARRCIRAALGFSWGQISAELELLYEESARGKPPGLV